MTKYPIAVAVLAALALPLFAGAQAYVSVGPAGIYVSAGSHSYQQYYSPVQYTYTPYQYQTYQPYQMYSSGYGSSYGSYNYGSSGYTQSSGAYPNSYSYPSGTYDAFGNQLCYWSDYPDYAPCGSDPQQWIQDPYTGQWY